MTSHGQWGMICYVGIKFLLFSFFLLIVLMAICASCLCLGAKMNDCRTDFMQMKCVVLSCTLVESGAIR